MDHHERRLHALVGQVGIVRGDLDAFQQPLVDDRLRVERDDVEALLVLDIRVLDGVLEGSSTDVEASIERLLIDVVLGSDDDLPDVRFGVDGGLPEIRVIGRDVPPLENLQIVGRKRLLDERDERRACRVVLWEKERADGIELGEIGLENVLEEGVRSLQHDTRPVAGVLLRAGGSAMLEISE